MQRRVLRVGRAVHRQPADHALARALDHPLAQRAQQPRLADPGLAAEQHRLAHAAARLLPAVGELIELAGAADQRRQVEAEIVPGPARLADAVGHEGLGHAADRRQRRHRLGGEPAPHQRARRRADHDGAGRGRRLQPQRHVERGAEHHRLRHVRAGRDDGQAGVDADAEGGLLLLARRGAAEVIRGLGDQVERGADGAAGVVFVRLRIAEVDEHAMADDVADRRLVALRHLLRQRAQPHHQLVERLGVERLRRLERRAAGVDDLAAQHRELAALAAREQRRGRRRDGGLRPRHVAGPHVERGCGRDLLRERAAPAGLEHAGPFQLLERGDHVEAAVRPVRRRLAQQPVGQLRQLARDAGIDVERPPAARRCRCGSASPPRSRRGTARCRSPSRRAASRARTDRTGDRWPGPAPARATSHGRCRAPRPGPTGPARHRRDTSWPGRSRGSWRDRPA